jgi:hypothetical protein
LGRVRQCCGGHGRSGYGRSRCVASGFGGLVPPWRVVPGSVAFRWVLAVADSRGTGCQVPLCQAGRGKASPIESGSVGLSHGGRGALGRADQVTECHARLRLGGHGCQVMLGRGEDGLVLAVAVVRVTPVLSGRVQSRWVTAVGSPLVAVRRVELCHVGLSPGGRGEARWVRYGHGQAVASRLVASSSVPSRRSRPV